MAKKSSKSGGVPADAVNMHKALKMGKSVETGAGRGAVGGGKSAKTKA